MEQQGTSLLTALLVWLPVIANLVLSIGSYLMLFRKLKPEIDKIEAETDSESASAVQSYATATKIYSEELAKVREELQDLSNKIKERDETINARDRVIAEQSVTIKDLTDWAERLVYQVKSLGVVPVPFKVETKNIKAKPTNG